MREEAKAIDDVMEAASGPHFSGLRLDGLLSSPSDSPRAAAAGAAASPYSAQSDSGSSIGQPFVIGELYSSLTSVSPRGGASVSSGTTDHSSSVAVGKSDFSEVKYLEQLIGTSSQEFLNSLFCKIYPIEL